MTTTLGLKTTHSSHGSHGWGVRALLSWVLCWPLGHRGVSGLRLHLEAKLGKNCFQIQLRPSSGCGRTSFHAALRLRALVPCWLEAGACHWVLQEAPTGFFNTVASQEMLSLSSAKVKS